MSRGISSRLEASDVERRAVAAMCDLKKKNVDILRGERQRNTGVCRRRGVTSNACEAPDKPTQVIPKPTQKNRRKRRRRRRGRSGGRSGRQKRRRSRGAEERRRWRRQRRLRGGASKGVERVWQDANYRPLQLYAVDYRGQCLQRWQAALACAPLPA